MNAGAREQFAKDALAVVASVFGPGRASCSEDDFALVIEDADVPVARLYLSNAFAEARDASLEHRLEVLRRLVSAALPSSDLVKTWHWVRPRLRTVLRPTIQGIGQPEIEPPLSAPTLPHLREVVVVDMPDSLAHVAPSLIEHWGVTADEVIEAARSNLANLAGQMLAEVTKLSESIAICRRDIGRASRRSAGRRSVCASRRRFGQELITNTRCCGWFV